MRMMSFFVSSVSGYVCHVMGQRSAAQKWSVPYPSVLIIRNDDMLMMAWLHGPCDVCFFVGLFCGVSATCMLYQ